eukprot:4983648-Pyramimonas_sp.AAC.1
MFVSRGQSRGSRGSVHVHSWARTSFVGFLKGWALVALVASISEPARSAMAGERLADSGRAQAALQEVA